jgi:cell division protein FtsZ
VGSTLDLNMEGAIRVSVVATGIDVTQARAEAPIQRRPMAQPLPQMAAPAPRAMPPLTVTPAQQVAATPVYAPAPQPVQMEEDHPQDLFDAVAEPQYAADDLPPPAYRPQPQQQPQAAARPMPAPLDNDAADFVAPRPRTPGTPSPEAMARLKAAAARVPPTQAPRMSAPPAQNPRPAEKSRFGIGSLINRMAGALEAPAERAAPRQQPQVTSYDDEPDMNADQERIEIPAFLRRQAN